MRANYTRNAFFNTARFGLLPKGMQGNGIGPNGCSDINGCSPAPCATLEGAGTQPACSDVKAPGTGFTCAACPSGYDRNAVSSGSSRPICKDLNACKNAPCDKLTKCTDLKAPSTGFTCSACPRPSGYSGDGKNGCKDINDCKADQNGLTACGAKGTGCTDTGTSFTHKTM